MKAFAKHPELREAGRNLTMQTSRLLPGLALLFAGLLLQPAFSAQEDGVALSIIYDTWGSMKEFVPNKEGKMTPKYQIGNRALIAVANQIEKFATQKAVGSSRKIETGLYIFGGTGAQPVVKFGPFDADTIKKWAENFSNP